MGGRAIKEAEGGDGMADYDCPVWFQCCWVVVPWPLVVQQLVPFPRCPRLRHAGRFHALGLRCGFKGTRRPVLLAVFLPFSSHTVLHRSQKKVPLRSRNNRRSQRKKNLDDLSVSTSKQSIAVYSLTARQSNSSIIQISLLRLQSNSPNSIQPSRSRSIPICRSVPNPREPHLPTQTIKTNRVKTNTPRKPIAMAPMRQQSNYSSSNFDGEAVVRQANVLASCYIVDSAATLRGLHYCTTGAAGTSHPFQSPLLQPHLRPTRRPPVSLYPSPPPHFPTSHTLSGMHEPRR